MALALALLLGAALVALVAFLEARAARRPYDRVLNELVAEERAGRFRRTLRAAARNVRANRSREGR